MKKQIITFFAAAISFIQLNAQVNFQWVSSFSGIDEAKIFSMVLDGNGNIYTAGHFFGPTDFDPGAGNTTLTAIGQSDVFISKLDANGNLIWAKSVGGNSIEYNYGIAVDASGNVYVSGYYHDTADFDPGTGVFNLISQGSEDIFICKLDMNGNFVWAKSLGGSGSDVPRDIKVDATGNIYTTGFFTGVGDFDPSANLSLLISGGDSDIFMSKLDANGNFVWVKRIGGTGHSEAYQLKLDGSGNIYLTGYFRDTEDFDPSGTTVDLISVAGNDIFVAKYDSNGNYLWAKKMGGMGYERAKKLLLDTAGNIYITGNFDSTVDFDPSAGTLNLTPNGMDDCFIAKLDATGNLMWAKSFGGTQFDEPNDIALDNSGNLFITGYYNDVVDFDAGSGTSSLTATNVYADFFITKYDNNGNFSWVKSIGGNGNDMATLLALNGTGSIYIAGHHEYSVDFNPGTAVNSLVSGGSDDAFILKLFLVPAGISDINTNTLISIYPNPSNGILTIDSEEVIEEVTIRNVLGETILKTNLKQIDISKEAKGIYFATVQTEKGIYTERVIVK